MKNIKRILIFPMALIITLFQSCSEDFTNETTEFIIDSENFFNSEEDYNSALIGAYDLLAATYVNVLLGEIASDNTLAGGESPTDVAGFQQVDDMIHTPVNSNLKKLSGRLIHIRDDWKSLATGDKDIENAYWKLRRVQK